MSAIATPANFVTITRLFVSPLLFAMLAKDDVSWGATLLWGVLALTDGVDGWIARRQGATRSGAFLDPLADKLIVMATLVWMVPMGRIPEWAVALLLARELSITGLRSIASSEGVVIAAGDDGKSKTALQMIGIIALIVGYPYHLSLGPIDLGVVGGE